MANENKKVQRTKALLKQGLFSVLKERPMSEVTVTELCRRAGINRNTFYAHYQNPQALLEEVEDSLVAQYRVAIEGAEEAAGPQTLIVGLCRTIARNHEVCGRLFFENGDSRFVARSLGIGYEWLADRWRAQGLDSALWGKLYAFIASGSTAILKKWLDDGMQQSPEEIALFIENASRGCVSAFRKSAGQPRAM